MFEFLFFSWMVLFGFFVAVFWIVVVIIAVFKAVKFYFGEYSILPHIYHLINVYLWACAGVTSSRQMCYTWNLWLRSHLSQVKYWPNFWWKKEWFWPHQIACDTSHKFISIDMMQVIRHRQFNYAINQKISIIEI